MPNDETIRVELGAVGFLDYKPTKVYQWEPKPDITPHELALCMPAFFGADIESLPPECLRHFQEEGTHA